MAGAAIWGHFYTRQVTASETRLKRRKNLCCCDRHEGVSVIFASALKLLPGRGGEGGEREGQQEVRYVRGENRVGEQIQRAAWGNNMVSGLCVTSRGKKAKVIGKRTRRTQVKCSREEIGSESEERSKYIVLAGRENCPEVKNRQCEEIKQG